MMTDVFTRRHLQGAPAGAEYQALLAEMQDITERAVTLLIELG
jgi:hypothetical protein